MVTRKSSYFSLSRSDASPTSPTPPEWDVHNEGPLIMPTSPDDSLHSRPLSTSTRTGGSRRPTLREILANNSPPPWTLTAFMAYLSTNHCLETLEFTMDAGRYKKHYVKVLAKAQEKGKQPSGKEYDNIKVLWQRLMEAYIQPNGAREVNLPSEVRDPLLNQDCTRDPPPPEALDTAVTKVYELMEDSVLVPFLNSFSPHIAQTPSDFGFTTNEQRSTHGSQAGEEKSRWRKSRMSRDSPPPLGSPDLVKTTSAGSGQRKSPTSSISNAFKSHRFSAKLSPTSSGIGPTAATMSNMAALSAVTSNGSDSGHFPGLTDDSGDVSCASPTNESPMTPPMSPPESDLTASPRNSRDSGTWKRFGRLGQWKPTKKRSQNFRDNMSMP